jgi:hypothetical protein
MPMMKNPIPRFGVDDQNDRPATIEDDKATQARAAHGSGTAIECSVGLNARLRHDEPDGQPGLASGTTRGTSPGGL